MFIPVPHVESVELCEGDCPHNDKIEDERHHRPEDRSKIMNDLMTLVRYTPHEFSAVSSRQKEY